MPQFCKLKNPSNVSIKGRIHLNGSKSISNRLLILDAISSGIDIDNLSNALDTTTLKCLLQTQDSLLDAGAGGTTFRFLTAYLAIQDGREVILTGSDRIQERPIGILVDALNKLGADITYLGNCGFPPLKIIGKKLSGGKIEIPADTSSQFITALLLIAPTLENGIELKLLGKVVSGSYIKMTLSLLEYFGVNTSYVDNTIIVKPGIFNSIPFFVEADWSAAAYYYAMVILAEDMEIELEGLANQGMQGDAVIADIAAYFGVETVWKEHSIIIRKHKLLLPKSLEIDFLDCPDLAQTVIVFCAALGVELYCKGLQTLRTKETDRILALDNELKRLSLATLKEIDKDNWKLEITSPMDLTADVLIHTYDDHRMAMAFAPLVFLNKDLSILHPEVVVKSYPDFWEDLMRLGVTIEWD